MKIKTNLLSYKDPDTGIYTPIPVIVSGDNEEIRKEINELNENIVQQGNKVSSLEKTVESLSNPEPPAFVDGVEEMTDTSKSYVNTQTGTVWVWKTTTYDKEVSVTDNIVATADNPYHDDARFGSGGDISSAGGGGYIVSPYIDLSKYDGKTIELHLDGVRYASETQETYIQNQIRDANMGLLYARDYSIPNGSQLGSLNGSKLVINGEKSSTIIMTPPMTYASASTPFRYIRFGGKGKIADSNIYITYAETQTVTEEAWTDTGVSYGGGGASIDPETLDKIAELNNEGTDPTTIKLLAKPVLDFYNASAYSDSDYSTSHLSKITYPCRADIPVPFTVKWNHNENAMRTTLVVDTKSIGTLNSYRMRYYDVTGFDNYPIYNLLPNTTYFYKVTHVLSDGNLVEAKSGSFKTSSESIRLINIDGTQNVRDLGGWTGLNGKKVKYGKIFRGASLSDSSFNGLMVTGKGRLSLAELKVQAELNLGAYDTYSEIAQTCAYKKIGYANYATAITNETYRAQFKEALEYIVSCLNGTLSSNGLPTIERNVYMHCQGGCDRTGTLSFQLLGLLGVSESDLAKEYELSSFSDIGLGRLRTTTKEVDTYDYVGMVQALKTYSGNTITEKFYNFAIACGVSADIITAFRNLMLE